MNWLGVYLLCLFFLWKEKKHSILNRNGMMRERGGKLYSQISLHWLGDELKVPVIIVDCKINK